MSAEVIANLRMSLFLRPEISDFVIIVGDQRLNVHKSVLMSSSEYFSALFNSEMIETKNREITLKETLIKPFVIVLRLAYELPTADEEWLALKIQELFESVITANKYQFLECERQLSRKTIDIFGHKLREMGATATTDPQMLTIWELLEMAKLHNLQYLFDACLDFFDENVSYAFKTFDNQFVGGDILLDVISRDTFGAPEFDIYLLVKKWIHKYRIRSNQKTPEESLLLASVRLNLMSFEELRDIRRKGLYEPEVLESVAKHDMSPALAQNKRVCHESGKLFAADLTCNELHLRDEQMVVVFVTFELPMPSKINHLLFTIRSGDKTFRLNAKYSILIADKTTGPVVYRQVLDYKQCSCVGEQELYFDEPFITSTIRIVVECSVNDYHQPITEAEEASRLGAAGVVWHQSEGRHHQFRSLSAHRHTNPKMLSINAITYEYSKHPLKTIDSYIVPEVNVCQRLGAYCLSTHFHSSLNPYLNQVVLNNSGGCDGAALFDTISHRPWLTTDKFVDSFDGTFEMRVSPELSKARDRDFETLFANSIQQPITRPTDHYVIRLTQPIYADCLHFELIMENERRRKFDECLAAECRVEVCPAFAGEDVYAIADWLTISDDSYLTESGFYNLEFPLQKVSAIRITGCRYNSDKTLKYVLHLKNFSIPADRSSWSWSSGSKLGNESMASDDMTGD